MMFLGEMQLATKKEETRLVMSNDAVTHPISVSVKPKINIFHRLSECLRYIYDFSSMSEITEYELKSSILQSVLDPFKNCMPIAF